MLGGATVFDFNVAPAIYRYMFAEMDILRYLYDMGNFLVIESRHLGTLLSIFSFSNLLMSKEIFSFPLTGNPWYAGEDGESKSSRKKFMLILSDTESYNQVCKCNIAMDNLLYSSRGYCRFIMKFVTG